MSQKDDKWNYWMWAAWKNDEVIEATTSVAEAADCLPQVFGQEILSKWMLRIKKRS